MLPSGHMTLKQRQNLIEIRSLRCFKKNVDVVPTYSNRWVPCYAHAMHVVARLGIVLKLLIWISTSSRNSVLRLTKNLTTNRKRCFMLSVLSYDCDLW